MIICFSHLIQYHNSLLALSWNRECPFELREAIASIIFASGRCSDLPELMHLRTLFTTKYGKEFVAAAMELRPDSGVNRTIIEKLSVKAPSAESKLKVLKAIAQEYGLEWDSSNTEAELNKKYEDLLVTFAKLLFFLIIRTKWYFCM
jgi:hypothetical protein